MQRLCALAVALGVLLAGSIGSLSGQSAPPPVGANNGRVADEARVADDVNDVQNQRALLDKFCVTCHSDRLKTANLSLQSLNPTKVADHAEVSERRSGSCAPV